MSILERDRAILERFESLSDWEGRYQRIIKEGRALKPLSESDKNDDLKVRGCQSQVWLKADYRDGCVYYKADSDALIAKGLIALLLELYSGSTCEEIIQHQPLFVEKIGLRAHLSPSRANGLYAMLKQIKVYAIAFQAKATANQ